MSPRSTGAVPDDEAARLEALGWYDNWLVALSAAVGVGVGAIYLVFAKPYLRSDAISGDAIPRDSVSAGNEPGRPGPTRRK